MLHSFQRVLQRLPKCHLVLAGQGPSRAALETLAGTLGVAASVRWIGPHAHTEALYPFFDVLTLPSLSEGFPMTLLEAMACACPVVATRVGGVAEALPRADVGLCVNANDPEALAAGLLTFLQNPALSIQTGETARQRAEQHFNLQQTLQQINALYEEVSQNGL